MSNSNLTSAPPGQDDVVTAAEAARARTTRELQELIAALDRRVPQVERVGEIAIARAAAALREEALKRIHELDRDALLDEAAAANPGADRTRPGITGA